MTFVQSESIKGKFTHWLDRKYKKDVLKGIFDVKEPNLVIKPKGIWLSWNGGWEGYCREDYTSWMKGKVMLNAKIKSGLRIWLIDDVDDFMEVWNQFELPAVINPKIKLINDFGPASMMRLIEAKERGIDFWEWFQKKFKIDGVALTDTGQCRTRMTTWLYGWDAQSIVIFNPNNVILAETK